MFGYIIVISIITNVQKISLHAEAGCLATRQKGNNCTIQHDNTVDMAT